MTSLSETSMLAGSSGVSTGYTIDQSIRFNDNDSPALKKTYSGAGTEETFTFSCWVKRGNIGASLGGSGNYGLCLFSGGSSVSNYGEIRFESSGYGTQDSLFFYSSAGGSINMQLATNRVFRDVSAWYHVVCVMDTTNAIASERLRMYINGVRETSFGAETYPAKDTASHFNTATEHGVGVFAVSTDTRFFDGYMAEIHFLDGYAYDSSYFGEFKEDTDIWIPKEYTGSYGTNGFKIDGRDSSDLGDDESGQGNDYSSSGLAANDQVLDSPTNNFAVLNPNDTGNRLVGEIRNGNLELKDNSASQYVYGRATFGFDIEDANGWYWEVLSVVQGSIIAGITDDGDNLGTNNLAFTGAKGITARGGGGGNTYWKNEDTTYTGTNYGVSTAAGNIISFCAKNGKLFIAVNNTYVESGNPATEANPQYSSLTGQWFPYVGLYSGASYNSIANFGQDGTFAGNKTAQGNTDANGFGNFFYAPPTGAKALCSRSLGA